MAKMSKKRVSLYMVTVLSHAFGKFTLKINVSNSFNTLPM